MHELTLMNDLMRKIAAVAQAHHTGRITGVTVRLGALAHISAEHFRDHFVIASRDTVAAGARLNVETAEDVTDPHAQDIRLLSVDIDEC